jgi:hypothetical protein
MPGTTTSLPAPTAEPVHILLILTDTKPESKRGGSHQLKSSCTPIFTVESLLQIVYLYYHVDAFAIAETEDITTCDTHELHHLQIIATYRP